MKVNNMKENDREKLFDNIDRMIRFSNDYENNMLENDLDYLNTAVVISNVMYDLLSAMYGEQLPPEIEEVYKKFDNYYFKPVI